MGPGYRRAGASATGFKVESRIGLRLSSRLATLTHGFRDLPVPHSRDRPPRRVAPLRRRLVRAALANAGPDSRRLDERSCLSAKIVGLRREVECGVPAAS